MITEKEKKELDFLDLTEKVSKKLGVDFFSKILEKNKDYLDFNRGMTTLLSKYREKTEKEQTVSSCTDLLKDLMKIEDLLTEVDRKIEKLAE